MELIQKPQSAKKNMKTKKKDKIELFLGDNKKETKTK